jgi:lipopolysaccharide transport system permease protein
MLKPADRMLASEGLVASFWFNRSLIVTLTIREIAGRYRGSMLGIFWSFLNPLLMLLVYTFVFTEVFQIRWRTASSSKIEFAIVLFAGLILFSVFAECVSRAPALIVNNPNYVRKVVFPLQTFAWVTLLTAAFHYAIGLIVLLIASLFAFGSIPLTACLLPLLLVPFLLFCIGLTWFLSAIGVFVRDIGQVIGLVVTALMFLSPLFYPAAAVPANYRWLFDLNPLSFPIEASRKLLIWGQLPDWTDLGLYTLFSSAVALLGLWWFNQTRRGFADVL